MQKIGPQLGISPISGHFWPKIGLGLGWGLKIFKIGIKVGVGVAKLKKIVVDVGVGVAISKKIGLWLGLGMFWATKLWCCCGCGWCRS